MMMMMMMMMIMMMIRKRIPQEIFKWNPSQMFSGKEVVFFCEVFIRRLNFRKTQVECQRLRFFFAISVCLTFRLFH